MRSTRRRLKLLQLRKMVPGIPMLPVSKMLWKEGPTTLITTPQPYTFLLMNSNFLGTECNATGSKKSNILIKFFFTGTDISLSSFAKMLRFATNTLTSIFRPKCQPHILDFTLTIWIKTLKLWLTLVTRWPFVSSLKMARRKRLGLLKNNVN